MKKPFISEACVHPPRDKFLEKILQQGGTFYHAADLFYQELWKLHLNHLGFRVLKVERLPYHPVWSIRLCGNLTTQTFLLISKPYPAKLAFHHNQDLLCRQLGSEVQRIAKDLGSSMKRDCLDVVRQGSYFHVSFLWPLGRPGTLLKQEKCVEAFSFLIRPWLRRNRN